MATEFIVARREQPKAVHGCAMPLNTANNSPYSRTTHTVRELRPEAVSARRSDSEMAHRRTHITSQHEAEPVVSPNAEGRVAERGMKKSRGRPRNDGTPTQSRHSPHYIRPQKVAKTEGRIRSTPTQWNDAVLRPGSDQSAIGSAIYVSSGPRTASKEKTSRSRSLLSGPSRLSLRPLCLQQLLSHPCTIELQDERTGLEEAFYIDELEEAETDEDRYGERDLELVRRTVSLRELNPAECQIFWAQVLPLLFEEREESGDFTFHHVGGSLRAHEFLVERCDSQFSKAMKNSNVPQPDKLEAQVGLKTWSNRTRPGIIRALIAAMYDQEYAGNGEHEDLVWHLELLYAGEIWGMEQMRVDAINQIKEWVGQITSRSVLDMDELVGGTLMALKRDYCKPGEEVHNTLILSIQLHLEVIEKRSDFAELQQSLLPYILTSVDTQADVGSNEESVLDDTIILVPVDPGKEAPVWNDRWMRRRYF